MADEKDFETLAELEEKMIEQQQIAQSLADSSRRNKLAVQRSQLTLEEVSQFPDDARMYRSVGRAYLFAPKGEIIDDIKTTISSAEAEVETAKSQLDAVVKKLEETRGERRELIKGSPGLQRMMTGGAPVAAGSS